MIITKPAKALLLFILFLTTSISSMDQFTLPNLILNNDSKKSSPILFCCAVTAIVLSYLDYKWINPIKKTVNYTIPSTTESPTSVTSTQLWIETTDDITLSINIKNYLPKCSLRYLLKKYKQYFGHYNDAETPLKIGCSFYDLTLLKWVSSHLKSHMSQFNFNDAQQAILLEMASTFKIHSLYVALLNTNLPPEINTK
jgi:hypothetical protein